MADMANMIEMSEKIETREEWRNRAPFSAEQTEKDAFFQRELNQLTEHHRKSCQAYDDICHGLGEEIYLPVALFKDLELRSVPQEEVVRQVTSSGTTGQQVSRIYLDAATAELQRWALASITGDFIGGHRMPMLIIDSPDVLRDRRKFSARGAGILGFSMMSSKRFYALDEQMRPDWDSIRAFQDAAKAGPSFAFGFTFMIWAHFYRALREAGKKLDLNGCYLIHGGGWKKLQDQKVSDEIFRRSLREQCGFGEISDYYGMAEQTGSIFMQCPEGHLHASVFSDIDVLDPVDFTPCEIGQWGLIALRSWIPGSYPGHRLLTEDWGRILGTDDCLCGRKGKYFEIGGRIRKAEIRGCSDTFAVSAEAGTGSSMSEELDVLAGQWPPLEEPMPAFDPLICNFLEELSRLFMKDAEFRQYPDIYALGFWLRDGHRKQLQKRQEQLWQGQGGRSGLGLVLHIAPSNMPAMFAYSWITSLLAGNPNIVRLSGRDAEISDAILRGIDRILAQPAYEPLRRRNAFVRFPRGHRALQAISGRASARVIWGGDETVARICAVPKAEEAIDIIFPDRYSIAVLDEDAVGRMTEEELRLQANLFFRDTYGADQNACSSPRSVFWIREEKSRDIDAAESAGFESEYSRAKQRWWDAVAAEAKRYELQPWMATEKYRLLCVNYAKGRMEPNLQVTTEEGSGRESGDPVSGNAAPRTMRPVRCWTNQLYVIPCGRARDWYGYDTNHELPEARLGMFYEFDLADIDELMPLLQAKIQTVVCIGTDPQRFLETVRSAGCAGVDRAVGAGEALEFDTIWDRKDMIDLLSK